MSNLKLLYKVKRDDAIEWLNIKNEVITKTYLWGERYFLKTPLWIATHSYGQLLEDRLRDLRCNSVVVLEQQTDAAFMSNGYTILSEKQVNLI